MLKIKKRIISSWPLSGLGQGRVAVFVSGFTMIMVQVLLLRELTSLFAVNELIVGVFLSFWMLFAGAGAFTARYFKSFQWRYSGLFPLLTGVSAYLSLWVLYLSKAWLVPVDVAPGLGEWLVIAAVITFVFCFPAGMMFTWFSASLSQISQMRQTESVYVSEQLGSLIAGLLFSLGAGLWLDAFAVISFLLLINFLVFLFLIPPVKRVVYRVILFVSVLVIALMVFSPQYNYAREKVLGTPVRKTFFSPYGSIDVLGKEKTVDFFGKGHFFAGQLQAENREERLHPALLLHPHPQRLLLINVGPGLLSEALKYESLQIDFLSSDKACIDVEKTLLATRDDKVARVRFIPDDPVRYLNKKSAEGYDVVLVGGGIPKDLASTRFLTIDFFSALKRHMNDGGLLVAGGMDYHSFGSGPVETILNSLEETLGAVLPYIRIWAGEKIYFVASDSEVRAGWWDYHPKVVAQNSFVNEDHFPSETLEKRIRPIATALSGDGQVNTRIKPVLFRMALHDMENFLNVKMTWLALVLGIMVLVGLLVFRRSSRGVFMSGIVLGGMQVVILLFWQLVMGDLYRATGVLFSVFMGGLALGGVLGKKQFFFFRERYFPVMLVAMGLLSEIAIPILDRLANLMIFPFMVFVFGFLLALLGGGIFVVGLSMCRGRIESNAAITYGADVAGGALGSFLTAIFLVPFSGLVNTGYLLGMGLLIGGLLLIKKS
ncbi:spermine synthase [Thermophagus sp. OGC60D27]|uniref:spermine synthase n=1 Tax=Thermophagus sp. OGC60D27 TaxID=3458415 RepID=UPI0040381D8C